MQVHQARQHNESSHSLSLLDPLVLTRVAEFFTSLFSIRALTDLKGHNGISIFMQILGIVRHVRESSLSAGFTSQGVFDQHDTLIVLRRFELCFC